MGSFKGGVCSVCDVCVCEHSYVRLSVHIECICMRHSNGCIGHVCFLGHSIEVVCMIVICVVV